jgi:uncharacterized repeat protein (TIGR01451 family)
MKEHPSIRNRGKTFTEKAFALALALIMLVVMAGAAFAAAPNAGQTIGNQATATYQLNGVVQPQAQSNTVTTTVQQVAGLTITTDQTKSVAVGGTVYFLHTVTNTGNGSDTFNLTTVAQNSGSPNLSLTTGLYADTGSGAGAALSPAQTTTLARNASFTFYVGTTATSSTLNSTNTVKVTATSQFNNLVNTFNTDTVNLSNFAVLNFLKFATANTGKSGDPVIYTIRYTNNGNNPATNVRITDVIPAGMTYVAGSALWTVNGVTALTDATGDLQGPGGAAPTIDYSFDGGTKKVTAVVSQVPIGATADLTFKVTVNANLGPQVITNTAHYIYNDGNVPSTPDATVTADFTINTVRTVVLDDIGSTNDQDGSIVNKTVTRSSAAQGGIVWFDNVIHNNGNIDDTYQMSYVTPSASGSAFPAGSSIQYYDGLNGGLLGGGVSGNVTANGGTYHVWVKVTLPMNTGGGGPYTLTLKATSSGNAAISDTDTDTLTTIVAAAMDITNGTARSDSTPAGTAVLGNAATTGFGISDGSGPAITTTTGSNTVPAVFSLYMNNTGQTPEAFTMAYSATTAFGPAAALPAGWTVAFTAGPGAGTCSAINLGAALAGNVTAIINGGANAQICAVITPPASVAGNLTVDVYFKATGNSTGAADVKHDAVTTAKAYALTLTPNNTGSIVPNGTKVYTHQLCNDSNVAVGQTALDLTIATTGDTGGFTSMLYLDAALTTILTDVHQLNGSFGLGAKGAANACATIYVKVNAPGSPLGAVDTTTINVYSLKSSPPNKIVAFATDQTTMSLALTIDKSQVIDPTCNSDLTTLIYSTSNITAGANPGACIAYKLLVTNLSSTDPATLVTISDALTPYTAYSMGSNCFPHGAAGINGASAFINGIAFGGTITQPAECAAAGTVTVGPLTLNPGSNATIYFRVQIQN